MEHGQKRASIKRDLLALLVYCWVMPVLAISVFCIMYIQTVVMDRAQSTVRTNFTYASRMTATRMDGVIAEMRAVIVDGVLGTLYSDYARTRETGPFAFKVRGELAQRFRLKSEYLFAGVCFEDNPQRLISTSQYGSGYADYYLSNVHAAVLSGTDRQDNTTHILSYGGNLYLYQNLLDKRSLQKYGVLVVQLDPRYMFEYFGETDPLPQFAMLQFNGQVFWLTDAPAEKLRLDVTPFDMDEEVRIGSGRGYICTSSYEKLENYRFGYRVYIDDRFVTEKMYAVLLLAVALMCLVAPVLGYALLRIYRSITEPIDALVIATSRIENEQWDTTIVTSSQNEFGRLISSFNKMSSKIRYLFEYAYREELAASESKIMMLQSQMNPHFLNNTLELINWKARLGGNEDISQMIEALGTLLDASLDRTNARVVPLRQELEYVGSYLFIIGQRFGRRLTVNRHINESLLDCYVPRLIIQPLIENAVVHGIEPAGSGTIDLRIGKMNGELAIEIINDGAGLSDSDVARIAAIMAEDYTALSDKQRRLGVKNVQERLRLLYGEQGSFTIQRMQDGKTLSRIVLPMQREPLPPAPQFPKAQ